MISLKKIFYIVLLLGLNRCGECDGSSTYQIKSVTPDPTIKWKCHYVADGLETCASWQKTQHVSFADTCSKFALSQILTRAQISKYQ
ncbi:MAG: hypothetical protein JSS79_00395 [Bacteroidetes bacterium]|nr:hypothetical protein [Bacteroidota bacterium]